MDKHVVHIDASGKYHREETVGVAFISECDRSYHKGLVLSGRLIKSLISRVPLDNNFSALHAVCIYILIRSELAHISKMIICCDEDFVKVSRHLGILLQSHGIQSPPEILSLSIYRQQLRQHVKSLADGKAASYRKRGLHSHKHLKGVVLNIVKVGYEQILELLGKLDQNKVGE